MADVHDIATRSYNMSRIKSKNTTPELVVRKFLFSQGFRYRIHDKRLPGKPDIVLPKYKTVIFVHGCFWHGHKNCRTFVVPKTRTKWWLDKIAGNQKNDGIKIAALRKSGWNVIEVFECQLKKDKFKKTADKIVKILKSKI